ncbi:hypothetical protein EST38_g1034 [Candolleomyces aberdarensis]|uniref:Rho1 guanine nucleotide exchange factor 1 n=1 Tax=Candolleomyces aberdarensis TaxID=2316362 RepID=A0A4Q2DWV6_9AGAR|nr:hypothetical protein EST38_g1034 [Candolleomyces aberdarensis]
MSGLNGDANHDDELEGLYRSVLAGYPIAPPQPTRTVSSSGRPVRPLPPTPGGGAGRPPIVPQGSSALDSAANSPIRNTQQSLPQLTTITIESAPDVDHNDYASQPPPLDTHPSIPLDSDVSATLGDGTTGQAWDPSIRPVSTNEYDLTDLPVYIRSPEDDPNAVSVLIDPYHGAASQSTLELSPETPYQPEQPLYAQSEDGNYETTPGGPSYVPLPLDTDDRPPYHPPEPDYPEEHETVSDLARYVEDLTPSEASTFVSGEFPMLQRPASLLSTGSNGTAALPYIDEPDASSQNRFAASSSSWNNNNGNIPVRTVESNPSWNRAGPSNIARRVTNDLFALRNFDQTIEDPELDAEYYEDPDQFLDLSLLSNIAVQLQLKVPRGIHVKGSIPYPGAFTGKDIVTSIHAILEQKLIRQHSWPKADRRVALQVARSLQKQLFFYEVEWNSRTLQDGVEDVYMFLDESENTMPERAELPSGVVTMLTKCYSIMCIEAHVLRDLPEYEISRQTIIHKLISKEEQYVQDLDTVEEVFIDPLRTANVVAYADEFIEEVFGNLLDLRDCNRRLLEVMSVRQREEAPIIKTIGDIFLHVATEFRVHYPAYVGRRFLADKRINEELETNAEFRLFIEKCERGLAARGAEPRMDLRRYLNRPAEHLQKYPVLLEAVYHETPKDNPDGEFLLESITAIKNLQNVAQLRTFQSAMGKGPTGKWEWHDLLAPSMRKKFSKEESHRQSLIFELIKGEMAYVRDLENIDTIYLRPLRNAEPPIIPTERLDQFLQDVFHNCQELHAHHRRLIDKLHEIQLEEHPRIKSITAAIFDAALNFREAYMEYIPSYPIAAYRIDEEMATNPRFKTFVEESIRHPDAGKHDVKAFVNRPIPRLLRYELLLKEILGSTPSYHDDRDAIPEVIELISSLARETQPGVESAKQKVELWRYNANLIFKTGEAVDMELLDENRSLLHAGKVLARPDNSIVELNNGWTELNALLFDNYLVLTKPREKDDVTKYMVYRRPIPLDLLELKSFTDAPTQRSAGLLRNLNGGAANHRASEIDPRGVYPFTIQHSGRSWSITLYAETAQTRADWKQRLEEAQGLRQVVSDSNRVFEMETLSIDTFLLPLPGQAQPPQSNNWHDMGNFTGKVTCSVPFNTPDGRGLVAVGCAEGVWIGFRHDSRSMRRVLHVRMVSQCAMLEDFGLFLVLADRNLFAYHIEALVPNPMSPQSFTSQTPQKINGSKEVQFFSVGTLHGRTLVIYMNKKGADSVFHVVEPVIDKITERPKASSSGLLPSMLSRRNKSDWFRTYRDFSLTGESYDLIFLKAKIAVLCSKGFEIMDMIDSFKSVTIPQKDNPNLGPIARRCESCKPLGMFRCSEDEFLLCYDEFGLYVDKHGIPSRNTGVIEWEGLATRVALHAPYILLFDKRFIEIRNIDTCRLSQILPGTDIQCVWDGRGADSTPAAIPEGTDENMSQEPRVHAVMNVTDPVPNVRVRGITQHVFELVPTLPLYLPGALSSPSTVPYYPQSLDFALLFIY